jgi:putative flippase GtrA
VTRQFAGFLVAGGIAAAANVGSRILFSRLVGLELAVILAYLVGMTVAFVLMRSAVFPPSAAPLARQAALFAAVTLLLARWLLPAAGVRSHVEEIAHVAGVCVPIVTSFLGHKYLSFR